MGRTVALTVRVARVRARCGLRGCGPHVPGVGSAVALTVRVAR
ncbi:hypothetical protein [Streptomyces sp. NPDC088789]